MSSFPSPIATFFFKRERPTVIGLLLHSLNFSWPGWGGGGDKQGRKRGKNKDKALRSAPKRREPSNNKPENQTRRNGWRRGPPRPAVRAPNRCLRAPPAAAGPPGAAEQPPAPQGQARQYSRPLGGPRPGPQRPSGPDPRQRGLGSQAATALPGTRCGRWRPGRARGILPPPPPRGPPALCFGAAARPRRR